MFQHSVVFWTPTEFILRENHFGLREGCGGTIRVFVRVDEQWGLSFEMTDPAGEDGFGADLPGGSDSSELRRLAAEENAALMLEHWNSLQQETAFAGETEGKTDLDLFACPPSETELGQVNADGRHGFSASDSADGARLIEGYSAENVFNSARASLEPQGIQHFWESGFWNDFFDPSKDFLSSFDGNFKRPVDPVHGDCHDDFDQAFERQRKTIKLTATFMDHVRDANVMNWKDKRDADLQTAIYRWHSMLGVWSSDVQVVSQTFCREGFKEQAQVLVDIFYNRAPATILKRCRSMSKMTNYFVDRGRTFPCSEPGIYEFLCVERGNGAPPSRLKGYIEALTFCRHVLGVTIFDETTSSRRCQGVAALDLNYKARQADPLTVKQLETLHQVLFHDEQIWNRVFAGMLLFCTYARSRWSDAQHGEMLIEDTDSSGACAYLEIATGVHKTAKALQLRHQYLPLVAPCIGVVAGNWGEEWCKCRKELGLHDLTMFPLMPAPDSNQEPTVRPLSSSEAGSWMRDLLKVDSSNKDVKVTSHSLKATCLSYAAKRGCSFEDRLSLGYRTHNLKMALCYSRDGAARPLRVLEQILREVRERTFKPDETRSGRLSTSTDHTMATDVINEPDIGTVDGFELVSPVQPAVEVSENVGNVDKHDEPSVSDHATTGSETETDVDTTVRPKISFRDIQAPSGTCLHQHAKLKTLHLMKNENRQSGVFVWTQNKQHV